MENLEEGTEKVLDGDEIDYITLSAKNRYAWQTSGYTLNIITKKGEIYFLGASHLDKEIVKRYNKSSAKRFRRDETNSAIIIDYGQLREFKRKLNKDARKEIDERKKKERQGKSRLDSMVFD